MISKIVIFTDLDGTLLHNETFKFENIRQYIKNLLFRRTTNFKSSWNLFMPWQDPNGLCNR